MQRLNETATEDREAFGEADRGTYFTNDFEEYQARQFQDQLMEELHDLFFHDIWGLAQGVPPKVIHVRVHPYLMLDIEKAHDLLNRPVPAPSQMEWVKVTNPQRWHLSFGTVYFHVSPAGAYWPIEPTELRLRLRPDEVHAGGRVNWCKNRYGRPRGLTIVEIGDEFQAPVEVVTDQRYGRGHVPWCLYLHPALARRVDLLNIRPIALSLVKRTQLKNYDPK